MRGTGPVAAGGTTSSAAEPALRPVPVQTVAADAAKVDRFSRLSASQLAQYRSCPRQWWLERVAGLKRAVPPVLMLGRAVEHAVCSVLRESPALVAESAPADILRSPLDDDGRPDASEGAEWVGPTLLPMPAERWPADRSALRAWAAARVEVHWPLAWEAAEAAWASDPNQVGDWAELDVNRAKRLVLAGIDLQLDEVERCLDADGGPGRTAWQAGERPAHPAPDGFPTTWTAPPASAATWGWTAAWDLARPWFVDPDAATFTLTSVHPDHWFQGEYDLVLRWDGDLRIIDLKASAGTSGFSQWYPQQLRLYAWLWSRTHPDAPPVSGLEIWYLDGPHRKPVDLPTADDLAAWDVELHDVWRTLQLGPRAAEDFPPDPAPLPRFGPGGVERDPGTPEARCQRCDHRVACDRWEERATLPDGGKATAPDGRPVALVPLGSVRARHTVSGRILGAPWEEKDWRGNERWHATLQDGSDSCRLVATPEYAPRGLTDGDRLVLDGALGRRFRGKLDLHIDGDTTVHRDEEGTAPETTSSLLGVRTVIDVRARIFSLHPWTGAGFDGSTRHKWEVRLVDATGHASLVAWNADIPGIARAAARGDEVTAFGVEVGEHGGRTQLTLKRHGRLVVRPTE